MLKKEKSLPVLPTGRIVFCGGKEDKVDWRKLATLDYYLSLILKERKKTPNDCDFSPCIDFNRMFGFDQNISICFPKAETIFQKAPIPRNTPAQQGIQWGRSHFGHRGKGTEVRAGTESCKVPVRQCLRLHSTAWEPSCPLRAKGWALKRLFTKPQECSLIRYFAFRIQNRSFVATTWTKPM